MKSYSTQSGFSLVETLVAITILLIVIVGPLTIVSTTSKSTAFSNEQVVIFYLAQEGAELAQKARDDLVLARFAGTNPTPWDDFIDETSSGDFEYCFNSTGCGLEMSDSGDGALESVVDCASSQTACDLYYDSDVTVRSRFTHNDSYLDTPAKRVIRFVNVDPGGTDEIQVTSTVEWRSGLTRDAQSVSVVTYLFDIYGN